MSPLHIVTTQGKSFFWLTWAEKKVIASADEILLHPLHDRLTGIKNGKAIWYAWGELTGPETFRLVNLEILDDNKAVAA
jgi:hypothetical protein